MKSFGFILLLAFFSGSDCRKGKDHHHGHGHSPLDHHLYPKSSGYNHHVMPPTGEEPLTVEVNTYIRELGPLNPQDSSFRIQLTFRQKFKDSRLTHTSNQSIHLLGEEVKHIWSPDTFIRNERLSQLHGTLHPNVYARISQDGEVLMSEKLTVIASCAGLAKNLREEGSAACNFDIASYGLPDNFIKYVWKSGNEAVKLGENTLEFLGEEFGLEVFGTENCTAVTATGTYDCLRIKFVFKKNP